MIPAAVVGEQLAYVDLVNRLTDLERLAVLPRPGKNVLSFPVSNETAATTRQPIGISTGVATLTKILCAREATS